jgi:hypothetical protein
MLLGTCQVNEPLFGIFAIAQLVFELCLFGHI